MGMHSATNKGKRVRVALTDGTVLIERFVERKAPYIWLSNDESGELHKIKLKDVRSFGIYKGEK